MVLWLEGSINGIDWSEITDSDQQILDNSGSHIWDVESSGLIWLRVKVVVNSGSIDLDKLHFSGKRRH